jgi:hypothetical protein
VHPGQRNAVILCNIGGQPLLGYARHDHVGPNGKLGQRRALVRPDLGHMLCDCLYFADRILDLHEVAADPLDRLRVRSEGDRSKPRRLDEAKHVRRDRHAHVVTASQQLPTDGDAGLNITRLPYAATTNFFDGT